MDDANCAVFAKHSFSVNGAKGSDTLISRSMRRRLIDQICFDHPVAGPCTTAARMKAALGADYERVSAQMGVVTMMVDEETGELLIYKCDLEQALAGLPPLD